MKQKHLPRRKFLGMAGLAAAAGFLPGPAIAEEPSMYDLKPAPHADATIIETRAICKQPGKYLGDGSEYAADQNFHPIIKKRVVEADRYMGWPTITKTKNGELLIVFSGDRDAHVCPWGKTQMIRSKDNGKTWSPPETINNTPLDDRDSGILQTAKGTLLVTWFTSIAYTLPVYATAYERYARYAEKLTPEVRDKWLGNWTRRSTDNGKTWEAPVRMTSTSPHGAIQLRDGRLLAVGFLPDGIVMEESPDDGHTWRISARLPKWEDPTARICEPHLIELKSGKLLVMIRNEPKDRTKCFLLQSESTDGGKTWSALRDTKIWGYPPHLLQLRNGWLIVSYGYRLTPFGERVCISRDEGKTWDVDHPIQLSVGISPDLGYPSTVELSDGSLLTAYYQAEKPGEPTVVMSTHWKLNTT